MGSRSRLHEVCLHFEEHFLGEIKCLRACPHRRHRYIGLTLGCQSVADKRATVFHGFKVSGETLLMGYAPDLTIEIVGDELAQRQAPVIEKPV